MTTTMLRELVRDPVTAGLCQVMINRVVCGDPMEATWAGGCVHEHVVTGVEVCAAHRELAKTPFVCIACERAGHKCMSYLREVTL